MSSNHIRNVAGMHAAPRCQASTRAGQPCDNPAKKGKTRCHVHGGSGAKGKNYRKEANSYKAAYLSLEQHVRVELRKFDKVIRKLQRSDGAPAALEELVAIRASFNRLTKLKLADFAAAYAPTEDERRAERDRAMELDARRRYTAGGQNSREMTRDRALGAMVGLAVGEAVGVTLSGFKRDSYQHIEDMDGGGKLGLRRGQWAGDTAMALALMESLTYRHGFDETDFMERLLEWRDDGEYSCTGAAMGMGATTREALARYERTRNPVTGETHADCLANGSLARMAPVAVNYWRQPGTLRDVAVRQSRTTHGGPSVLQACAGLADIIADAISGLPRQKTLAPRIIDDPLSHRPIWIGEWEGKTRSEVRGSNNAPLTLEAALWCVGKTESFEEAVLKAANLGEDAGSMAAVAGQIAGALYGACGIPGSWLEQLAWYDKLVDMTDALFENSWERKHAQAR